MTGADRVRCALYVRLSREDGDKQGAESESIQNQKALLSGYAAERGWEIFRVYCDEDYSGADRLRPGFNRMLADARAGEFQVLLCKSQSRFTRDMELVERYLHGLFPLWGVRFIAVADHADTAVKGNKKARQINGLVNEWYLEDLSENVRMVLDLKRRRGEYIGGAALYGYRKDPADHSRLLVDPEAARVVGQIFRWALAGLGRQAIAGRLNDRGVPSPARYKWERGLEGGRPAGAWNKTAVGRILRNEMYAGVMVQGRRRKVSYKSKALIDVPREGWFRVEGTHEAIVPPAVFEQVQRLLDLRGRPGGAGEAHPLAGLVRCMDCGSALRRTDNGRRGEKRVCYLRCGRYADSGAEKLCTRHAIRLDRLEALVLERLRERVAACAPPEALAQALVGQDRRRAALERERDALALQLERREGALREIYLDKASGVLTAEQFAALNRDFLAQRARLAGRLAELEEALAAESRAEVPKRIEALLELPILPRALAVRVIRRVEVGERDPGTGEQAVRIVWKV